MPDQIHNYAHNNEWLIRNLIFIGRVHDALALAKNMTELPQHPKYNTFKKRGSAKYGRMRLLQVLRTYELWDNLIALSQTPYLEPTDEEEEQINRLRYLGLAYYQTKNIKQGDAQLAQLKKQLDDVTTERKQSVEKAVTKAKSSLTAEPLVALRPDESRASIIDKAKNTAAKPYLSRVRKLEQSIKALEGHQAIAQGDLKAGYELLKRAG